MTSSVRRHAVHTCSPGVIGSFSQQTRSDHGAISSRGAARAEMKPPMALGFARKDKVWTFVYLLFTRVRKKYKGKKRENKENKLYSLSRNMSLRTQASCRVTSIIIRPHFPMHSFSFSPSVTHFYFLFQPNSVSLYYSQSLPSSSPPSLS